MAALIPRTVLRVAKKQTICASTVGVQVSYYSTDPRIIKNPTTAALRRGTGGRSSFNGIVCTVFGATGFIGPYICNQLGKIGTQLIIPHRTDLYHALPLKLCGDLGQVLFHPFDLRDEESIRRCIKHSNVVINLIGRDWETKNFTFKDVNVDAARKLARICREENVERFIHFSSLNAGPKCEGRVLPEGSRFLQTKWLGEQAVLEEFPNAVIIRPSFVFGEEDRFLNYITSYMRFDINKKLPMWKCGEQTEIQPVYVMDVSAGVAAIVKDRSTDGKIYQFVGPNRYKLRDFMEWLFNYFTLTPDEDKYRVVDFETSPLFYLKVLFGETFTFHEPLGFVSREHLERESTTDVVHKDLPKLEDLGIKLTEIETRMHYESIKRLAGAYLTIEYLEGIKPPAKILTN